MSKIRLHGTSSGYVEIAPAAAASNNTLTAPSTVGEIIAKDAAGAIGITSMKASNVNVGAAVTITESGFEASGIGITCANINGGQIGGRRNIVINGGMSVAQRYGTTATTPTHETYVVDRWENHLSQTGKFSVQQVEDAPSGEGVGKYSSKITSLSAYTIQTGDYFVYNQNIEGLNVDHLQFGTSSAKTVTISFYVKSSLTGTFSLAIRNSAYNRSQVQEYSISSANTWERKTLTFTGDTTGTWLTTNGVGIRLSWSLGGGSTYHISSTDTWLGVNDFTTSSSTSVVSTNAATLYITGVQMEIGTQATPFEHRSVGEEIELCKRYYQKSYPSNIPPGSVGSGEKAADFLYLMGGAANPHFMHQFHPEMRTTPTVTHYSVQNANTTGKITASTTDYSITGTNTNFNCATRYIIYVASGVTAADDVYSAWAADSEL